MNINQSGQNQRRTRGVYWFEKWFSSLWLDLPWLKVQTANLWYSTMEAFFFLFWFLNSFSSFVFFSWTEYKKQINEGRRITEKKWSRRRKSVCTLEATGSQSSMMECGFLHFSISPPLRNLVVFYTHSTVDYWLLWFNSKNNIVRNNAKIEITGNAINIMKRKFEIWNFVKLKTGNKIAASFEISKDHHQHYLRYFWNELWNHGKIYKWMRIPFRKNMQSERIQWFKCILTPTISVKYRFLNSVDYHILIDWIEWQVKFVRNHFIC